MLPLALALSKEKRLNVTSWEHPAVLAWAVPAEQRRNHGVREAAEGPRAGGARLPCDPTAVGGKVGGARCVDTAALASSADRRDDTSVSSSGTPS